MLSQHSRSQARIKEEGCDRLDEPTSKLSYSYGDETQKEGEKRGGKYFEDFLQN